MISSTFSFVTSSYFLSSGTNTLLSSFNILLSTLHGPRANSSFGSKSFNFLIISSISFFVAFTFFVICSATIKAFSNSLLASVSTIESFHKFFFTSSIFLFNSVLSFSSTVSVKVFSIALFPEESETLYLTT